VDVRRRSDVGVQIRVDDLQGADIIALLQQHLEEMRRISPPESVHALEGVGSRLLTHILEEAQRRGYRRLSLETGSMAHFAPARALYSSSGFHVCEPFGQYTDDPNSVFMTRTIA